MSKLSFRARALDATKPLPIYLSEEIPETADCSLINRAVPQMPTGMEKEEEAEHHLQQAIVAGTVIPTPEVFVIDTVDYYDRVYPEDFKLPRQLIYMQPFSMETDIPDYDMDSEDENWINSQAGKLELTPDKFEEMMDRLEKGSGQTVVTLQEAKALIKEDDDLIIAVYDYWLNKRLKTQQPLIPHVRTEARHGVANHNPYIAFRRRTEKMQTRKNRKNDESSYEKMLKLKRDLTRAVNLLDMVKRREKSKRELLHLTIEVFEKRYQAGDYAGQVVSEALQQRPNRAVFSPLFQPNYKDDPGLASLTRKERRQYKKRRHKSSSKSSNSAATGSATSVLNFQNAQGFTLEGEAGSSEDDIIQPASPSEGEEEDESVFSFRRRKDCQYFAPKDNSEWPWCSKEEVDKKYRFFPVSLKHNKAAADYRSLGPCRRRVGRGGRVLLDRMNIFDLRQLCRYYGYDPTQSVPSPSSSKSNNSPSHPESTCESNEPNTDFQRSEEATATTSSYSPPSPDYLSSTSLSCWHHFRPKSPEMPFQPEDIPSIEEDLETADEDSETASEELALKSFTDGLGKSCHLGLVVANGERPLTYSVDGLVADPPLFQDPNASHVETLRSDPVNPVILDEQASELANTYYLMELSNELMNDDIGVGADPWYSSMDMENLEPSPMVIDGDDVTIPSIPPQDFLQPQPSGHQPPTTNNPTSSSQALPSSSTYTLVKQEPFSEIVVKLENTSTSTHQIQSSQNNSSSSGESGRTGSRNESGIVSNVSDERTIFNSSNNIIIDKDDKENARHTIQESTSSTSGLSRSNEDQSVATTASSVSENGDRSTNNTVQGSEDFVVTEGSNRISSSVNSSRGLGSTNPTPAPNVEIVNEGVLDTNNTNSSFLRTSLVDRTRSVGVGVGIGSGGGNANVNNSNSNNVNQLTLPVGKIYPGSPAIIRRIRRMDGGGGNNSKDSAGDYKLVIKKQSVNGDGETGLLHRLTNLGDVNTLELLKTGEYSPEVDSVEFNNMNRNSSKNNQLHLTVNSNASSNNNSINVVTNSGPSPGKMGIANGPPVIPIADCEQSSVVR